MIREIVAQSGAKIDIEDDGTIKIAAAKREAIEAALSRIRGAVFGTCSECSPGEGYASFTLEEILDNHLKPLKVPAWQGAMIGHDTPQWTLPVGLDVEIDASAGTVRMTEAGVA